MNSGKRCGFLASAHVNDKKTVKLRFDGDGKRQVSVGYIEAAPIWKTTYRLVLGSKEGSLLQGWGIVENTTDEDWKDVSLTLVSGRPISFTMNLYDPLYLQRPFVVPEQFASLQPRIYQQRIDIQGNEITKSKDISQIQPVPALAQNPARRGGMMGGGMEGGMGGGMGGGAPKVEYYAAPAVAKAMDLGELFHYKIDAPVSLPRQNRRCCRSSIRRSKLEKLSIYDPVQHVKYPLNGLRLKNTTSLHLMQGPITVFDEGAYAGDARIEDMPPGGDRLISYAIDLDVEVATESKTEPEVMTSIKIVSGVLNVAKKHQQRVRYLIKNSAKEPKRVLIEKAITQNYSLVEPVKDVEKTRDEYRFTVEVPADKTAELVVIEEELRTATIAIANSDSTNYQIFISAPSLDEKVKASLQEVIKRKQKVSEIDDKYVRIKQRIESINTEQGRIRQNMATIDRTNDLYRRYVEETG